MNTSPLWHILCQPNYLEIRHRILRALPDHSLYALVEVENTVIFDDWVDDCNNRPSLLAAADAITEREHSEHNALRKYILRKFRTYDGMRKWYGILSNAIANNCPYPVLHDIWTIIMNDAEHAEYRGYLAEKLWDTFDGNSGHDYAEAITFIWQDIMLANAGLPTLELLKLVTTLVRKFIAAGCRLEQINIFIKNVQMYILDLYNEDEYDLYEYAISAHGMPFAAEFYATLNVPYLVEANSHLWTTLISDEFDGFQCHSSQIIPLLQHMLQHHGNCTLENFWVIVDYVQRRLPFTPEICTFLASLYNAPDVNVTNHEFDVLGIELHIIFFKHVNGDSVRFYFVRDYLRHTVLQRFSEHPMFSSWIVHFRSLGFNMDMIRAQWNI